MNGCTRNKRQAASISVSDDGVTWHSILRIQHAKGQFARRISIDSIAVDLHPLPLSSREKDTVVCHADLLEMRVEA